MAQELNNNEELYDAEDQIENSEVETVEEETLAAKSLHPRSSRRTNVKGCCNGFCNDCN